MDVLNTPLLITQVPPAATSFALMHTTLTAETPLSTAGPRDLVRGQRIVQNPLFCLPLTH